jgi:hypothetical protein
MYAQSLKIRKSNNLKVLGASKPKGLNRRDKIGYNYDSYSEIFLLANGIFPLENQSHHACH